MVAVPRFSHVFVALATMAGALRLAKWRTHLTDARIAALERENDRIAGLEQEAARLADEAQRAWRIKDDFLATLSHELRTPLNAMLGWIQLLRVHTDDAAMRAHAIDVLERNARAQVQIVADMLDVSRIITGGMRLTLAPLDLAAVVQRSCDSLAQTAAAKKVALRVDLQRVGGDVHGDVTRLQQVVWNLVSNAIKFTPSGGQVMVRVRPHEKDAEISVTDTGIGITAEVLPYVFDRFSQGDSSLTRPFGGLGLGLAIVRHLVELHGGSVQAASEGSNRGATFSVRLPVQTATHEA